MPSALTVDLALQQIWSIDQKAQQFSFKFDVQLSWIQCDLRFDGTKALAGKDVLLLTHVANQADALLWSPWVRVHQRRQFMDAAPSVGYWTLQKDGLVGVVFEQEPSQTPNSSSVIGRSLAPQR